jgi:hypothetical protein
LTPPGDGIQRPTAALGWLLRGAAACRRSVLPAFTPTLFILEKPIDLVFHPAANLIEPEAGAPAGAA